MGSDGPLAPDGTGHVTEHRIREHANAVEIDMDKARAGVSPAGRDSIRRRYGP